MTLFGMEAWRLRLAQDSAKFSVADDSHYSGKKPCFQNQCGHRTLDFYSNSSQALSIKITILKTEMHVSSTQN